MIKINALGIECPKPVIMTKKQLESMPSGEVEVSVDNQVSVQNLERFAENGGYTFESRQEAEDHFIVHITKAEAVSETAEVVIEEDASVRADLTIGIGSDVMGTGDPELGRILMKSYIYTISETEPFPTTMVFFNAGVKLTTEGSPVLEDLKNLEALGVEIISCGTCLDFYSLKSSLEVGEISNMYTIYEKLKTPGRNVILG